MRILAIDPGSKDGAAVLLEDGKVLHWWAWTKVTNGYRVRRHGLPFYFDNMHDLGVFLQQEAQDLGQP